MLGLQIPLLKKNRVLNVRNKYIWLPVLMLLAFWLPDLAMAQGLPMVNNPQVV